MTKRSLGGDDDDASSKNNYIMIDLFSISLIYIIINQNIVREYINFYVPQNPAQRYS